MVKTNTKLNKSQDKIKSRRLPETSVAVWLEKPMPEIQWDIEQLLGQGTTLIISGNTGVGKSWESKHLAFQFRLGGKWHGLQCRQIMPVYISLESTERQMQTRIRKLAAIYPTVDDINFIAQKGADFRLNTEAGKKNLFDLLRSLRQDFGVIMIDPLASFIMGKLEQVDWNGEVEPVLTEIKKEFGCSLVIDHNFRKKIQIYGHGEDMFAPDRLKGVADIMDRADNIVVFISESQSIKVEGQSTRIEIAKWIHAAKTRDAEWELEPHRVVWDYPLAMFKPKEGLGWTPPLKSKRIEHNSLYI